MSTDVLIGFNLAVLFIFLSQGIVFLIYGLKAERSSAALIVAGICLLCSHVIFVGIVVNSTYAASLIHLFRTDIIASAFIGPLLFLFIEKAFGRTISTKRMVYILTPSLAIIALSFPTYIQDGASKIEMMTPFYNNPDSGHLRDHIVDGLVMLNVLVFCSWSVINIRRYLKVSYSLSRSFRNLGKGAMYFAAGTIVVVGVVIYPAFMDFRTESILYIPIAMLLFSGIMVYVLIFNKEVIMELDLVGELIHETEGLAALDSQHLAEVSLKLEEFLLSTRIYRDPYLTITKLSTASNIPRAIIVHVMSFALDKTFEDYLDDHRVAHVNYLLNKNNASGLSLLVESGFTTFPKLHQAYKRSTGLSLPTAIG